LQCIELFDTLFVSWWIIGFLKAYDKMIPLSVKRKICSLAWEWYVSIHTLVVCEWMGFYADQSFYDTEKQNDADDARMSDGYKALSTLLYPCQFYPVDVPRIRFFLSQLNSVSVKELPPEEWVERLEGALPNTDGFDVPESQRNFQTVSGLYVTNRSKTQANGGPKKVLFWIYGGAYLGGDAAGNLGMANEFMVDCEADSALIPSYRLAPEATIDDVLWDICWSYRYLLRRLEAEAHEGGFEIIMVGISSGAALALRLMQFMRDRSFDLKLMPSFLEPLVDDIADISSRTSAKVAGAVMFGPYVDYRDPPPEDGSFVQYAKYDWIVTGSVQHYGLPYLNGFIPPLGDDLNSPKALRNNTNGRIQYSPVTHNMNDLPPLCIIAGEHEACYDMITEIVNKARGNVPKSIGGAGTTDVTIGIWKYMCHTFSMMQAFLPEGKASMEFSKDWIRTKTTNNKQE